MIIMRKDGKKCRRSLRGGQEEWKKTREREQRALRLPFGYTRQMIYSSCGIFSLHFCFFYLLFFRGADVAKRTGSGAGGSGSGIKVQSLGDGSGSTALHLAVEAGHLQVVKLLVNIYLYSNLLLDSSERSVISKLGVYYQPVMKTFTSIGISLYTA